MIIILVNPNSIHNANTLKNGRAIQAEMTVHSLNAKV